MDKRSIGVFDSGLGGLTVVKELKKAMPYEDITYFGDIARVPYGGRSRETIFRYTLDDIRFLLSKNVKAIVVACGTASSVLTDDLTHLSDIPIFTVIPPSCKEAVALTQTGRIAVIGTKATIRSGAHAKEITKLRPQTFVAEQACPLFVPLVENGYTSPTSPAVAEIVKDYLAPVKAQNPDTLILGCTHYPLLEEAITHFMGSEVMLVNMGSFLSLEVERELGKKELSNDKKRHGNVQYFINDSVTQFADLASVFLEENIRGFIQQVELVES